MDSRLVGTWRIVSVAVRTGRYDDPTPTWHVYQPDAGEGPGLSAVAHTFRADGSGEIRGRDAPARPEQFSWRVEEECGELYLTFDTPPRVSMRLWFQPDGRLIWEQNVFSRCTDGRRVWLDAPSGQWVGREYLSRFSAWSAYVLARDAAPAVGEGG